MKNRTRKLLFSCLLLPFISLSYGEICQPPSDDLDFSAADYLPNVSDNPMQTTMQTEGITCQYTSHDSAYEVTNEFHANAHPVGGLWANVPGSGRNNEWHCPGTNAVVGAPDPNDCPFEYNDDDSSY